MTYPIVLVFTGYTELFVSDWLKILIYAEHLPSAWYDVIYIAILGTANGVLITSLVPAIYCSTYVQTHAYTHWSPEYVGYIEFICTVLTAIFIQHFFVENRTHKHIIRTNAKP